MTDAPTLPGLPGMDADCHRPLCVDLDGTLVATDTLWESVMRLMRARPWTLLLLPLWLLGGRAKLKSAIAANVTLDPAGLPYREELLATLKQAAEGGRHLVLATAADQRVADAVAAHVGLFQEVLGSDGSHNLKAGNKLAALQERYGDTGFDYIGDSRADVPVLEAATRGYVVGGSKALVRGVRQMPDVHILSRKPSIWKPLRKALRPHQWAKNALVVAPVVLTPALPTPKLLMTAMLAGFCFCLCASAGYVLNDLLDLEADRAHATKRARPFAAGTLPVAYGPVIFVALIGAAFALALGTLSGPFAAMLALYFIGTVTYSLWLKSRLLVDVIVLAGLYTHRILSGGVATEIPISAWLLAFSLFLFLSLAFAKRYIELRTAPPTGRLQNRGYYAEDIDLVRSAGVTSGYLAVLIFSLYIEGSVVVQNYASPKLLWGAVPVLIYWISRVWFLAQRGEMEDDPVKFALRDSISWLAGLALLVIAALARFAPPWPG